MLVIRRAEQRDLRRILAIERSSFGRDAWDRGLFEEFLGDSIFLVAENGAKMAGYLIAVVAGSKAELASIATRPRDRQRGIGTKLMTQALGKLRRQRVDEWWLMVRTTNEAAIRFYRALGFRRVRRVKRYYEHGADAWRMRLPLRKTD